MTSPFQITPTEPTSLKLEPGQEGKFSFTVNSLEAPDQTQDVIFQALLIGPDGKGKEVDWLVVGPPRTLTITGGKTETVAITARPTPTSPKGKHAIRLSIADKDHPNDEFVYSSEVALEVVDKPGTQPPKKPFPMWLIAVIAGGVLLLGGGIFLIVKLTGGPPELNEACDPTDSPACSDNLVCSAEARKCLQPGGASCTDNATCDSGECVTRLGKCATRVGLACDPANLDATPCPTESHCDGTARTCVQNVCRPGDKQCAADGRSLSLCQADGTFKTEPCPANAAVCRDGQCQCAANQGRTCNCGGVVKCDGTCSAPECSSSCVNGQCCNPRAGASCGQCGGVIKCDGTCSIATPSNLNAPCGSCNGKIKCDGTCSIPTPSNFNAPCGDCGGRVQCNGACSITTPRCPAGFVVDTRTAGMCRSIAETQIFHDTLPIPPVCNFTVNREINVACGTNRAQSTTTIRNIAGGTARCEGAFATSNPTDCRLQIRMSTSGGLPGFCQGGTCDIVARAVTRRAQCTR